MERFIEVPGGRIFAMSEGDGSPLVLIHAAIVDLRAWDAVVPGFVAAGFQVIRYDMRGFGQTVTDDVEFDPRADLLAVMDAFGIESAAVIGNSMGGHIALDAAIEHPLRIVAVVTLGSAPSGFDGGLNDVEEDLFAESETLESARPFDLESLADVLVRVWADGPGQPSTRVPASIREAVRQGARDSNALGRIAGRPKSLKPCANERLGDLRCPVLAVAGALDISHEVKAAHRLEEAAPNARAVIWPDVAHMIAMEQPARLVELVTEFLRPLGADGRSPQVADCRQET
jgi:3-oxoadipate enol-lactonase